jgi:hypothetical protein
MELKDSILFDGVDSYLNDAADVKLDRNNSKANNAMAFMMIKLSMNYFLKEIIKLK